MIDRPIDSCIDWTLSEPSWDGKVVDVGPNSIWPNSIFTFPPSSDVQILSDTEKSKKKEEETTREAHMNQ